MTEREASGMNKPVCVRLLMARSLCRFFVAILLVMAGRTTIAQTVTNLHSFGSSPSDGKNPNAGLVQGSDGNFYGTTVSGGTNNNGTIFRISSSGSYSNLHLVCRLLLEKNTELAGL